ncbi:SDR family oxidoreductase [Desulfogranum japonicum]|uniref:SDR family oxidoreductase n=1 Tax=Desulfogranum japonicum TaxID=231447 RepID=UPI00041EBFB3|nr:SDR family oxidoreductase [Desulfogranum japonicum]
MKKNILITGATSGFGQACAERFAREGWKLIITGRRCERLQNFSQQHPEVPIYEAQLDVRDQHQVEEFVKNLPDEFRNIDVLFNNAGLALGLEKAHECNIEDWETMVDTNIKGLLYLTRCVLPHMVERNSGHIINMGSIAGNYPYPGGNTYGATKAFVKQFSRNLLTDLVHTQVRVTNIEPGLAESEFSIVRFHGNVEQADDVYKGTKPITPADIAECVFWAASMPSHININTIELMPTCQSCGPLAIHRT